MKYLLASVFAVAFVAMATADYTRHGIEERTQHAVDACIAEKDMNLPADIKEQVRYPDKMERPLLGKIAKCTMVKMGYMTTDGEIAKDVIKDKIKGKMHDPAKFDMLEEECNKKQATPEETAIYLHTCVREFHEKHCSC